LLDVSAYGRLPSVLSSRKLLVQLLSTDILETFPYDFALGRKIKIVLFSDYSCANLLLLNDDGVG